LWFFVVNGCRERGDVLNHYEIKQREVELLIDCEQYRNSAIRHLNNIFEYADIINNEQKQIERIRFSANDIDDYQDKMKALDQKRKLKHESAMVSLNVLNKMCDNLGYDLVYEGHISDEIEYRTEITESVVNFSKETDRGSYLLHA
jgi:hypothetical protein